MKTGPLSCKTLFSFISIILRFGLHIVSWISSCFGLEDFCILHFLTVVSMFSMVSSAPAILFSISCSVVDACHLWLLNGFHGFVFQQLSLFDLFFSTSTFRSWMFFFRSSTCLFLFSCNSLRDYCVSSLRASTGWPMFSCISLRDYCVSSLRVSNCWPMFSSTSLSELFKYLMSSISIMTCDF